jgi:biotin carboxyl carrier protein
MSRTYLGHDGPTTLDTRSGPNGTTIVSVGDSEVVVSVHRFNDGELSIVFEDGRTIRARVSHEKDAAWVSVNGTTIRTQEVEEGAQVEEDLGSLEAPMPGTVLKVNVAVGDEVKAGQTLLVLEAMKMEHEIKSPTDGVVTEIAAVEGAMVNPGKKLVSVDA